MSAVGKLIAEAAVTAVRCGSGGSLGADADDAGLQGGQLGPVTAVEGQFHHRLLFYGSANGGRGRLNRWGQHAHFDDFGDLAHLQGNIQSLLHTNVEDDAFLHGGGETHRRDLYFVRAWRQVWRRIEPSRVGRDFANLSVVGIFDLNFGIDNHRPRLIGDDSR